MGVFETSKLVFGEPCQINGKDYTCVVDLFTELARVVNDQPGEFRGSEGVVRMSKADWLDSAGKKGIRITLPFGVYRVLNEPTKSYETDVVELHIGPL